MTREKPGLLSPPRKPDESDASAENSEGPANEDNPAKETPDTDLRNLFTRRIPVLAGPVLRPLSFFLGVGDYDRERIAALIRDHGGVVKEDEPTSEKSNVHHLTDNMPAKHPHTIFTSVYKWTFITDCVEKRTLLDIDNYKLLQRSSVGRSKQGFPRQGKERRKGAQKPSDHSTEPDRRNSDAITTTPEPKQFKSDRPVAQKSRTTNTAAGTGVRIPRRRTSQRPVRGSRDECGKGSRPDDTPTKLLEDVTNMDGNNGMITEKSNGRNVEQSEANQSPARKSSLRKDATRGSVQLAPKQTLGRVDRASDGRPHKRRRVNGSNTSRGKSSSDTSSAKGEGDEVTKDSRESSQIAHAQVKDEPVSAEYERTKDAEGFFGNEDEDGIDNSELPSNGTRGDNGSEAWWDIGDPKVAAGDEDSPHYEQAAGKKARDDTNSMGGHHESDSDESGSLDNCEGRLPKRNMGSTLTANSASCMMESDEHTNEEQLEHGLRRREDVGSNAEDGASASEEQTGDDENSTSKPEAGVKTRPRERPTKTLGGSGVTGQNVRCERVSGLPLQDGSSREHLDVRMEGGRLKRSTDEHRLSSDVRRPMERNAKKPRATARENADTTWNNLYAMVPDVPPDRSQTVVRAVRAVSNLAGVSQRTAFESLLHYRGDFKALVEAIEEAQREKG